MNVKSDQILQRDPFSIMDDKQCLGGGAGIFVPDKDAQENGARVSSCLKNPWQVLKAWLS